MIFGRQQFSDALAGVKEGMWSGLRLHQVGPRPSINICQNRMCTFATFRARAAQRRRPISSNLGQKCLFSDRSKERLEAGFTDLGWTTAFYLRGVPAVRLLDWPSTSGFYRPYSNNWLGKYWKYLYGELYRLELHIGHSVSVACAPQKITQSLLTYHTNENS